MYIYKRYYSGNELSGAFFPTKNIGHELIERPQDKRKGETMSRIGILHPGEMGVSIAASAIHNGHQVYWVSEGRSAKTRARAKSHSLLEKDSFLQLCETCEIIISICPPHAAEDVASAAKNAKFNGLYLDANAISPQRALKIDRMMRENSIQFVDGGIIGGPAWKSNETCLYLSGGRANEIADCFSNGLLDTKILGDEIGKASALKMCYAANTKGTVALLAAILTTAENLGVREALFDRWKSEDPQLPEQVQKRIQANCPKAWRFVGEMEEISSTFISADAPGDFHKGARDIYQRLARFKDTKAPPTLEQMLAALCEPPAWGRPDAKKKEPNS